MVVPVLSHMWRGARLWPLCLAPAAFAQQYDVRTYTLEQGLPSTSVNALCEDAAGFLWIATDAGAVRTDGLRSMVIGRREGLSAEEVTALHAGSDGAMWMGLGNGQIVRWTANGLVGAQVIVGMEKKAVSAFVRDADGTLFAATLGGEVIRDLEGAPVVTHIAGGAPVRALVSGAMGDLLAGTDSGLYVLQGKEWERHFATDALPDIHVNALFSDTAGVLVGTAQGYAEFDPSLRPLSPAERFTGSFPIAMPDVRVLAIHRARDGDLWLGTPAGLVQLTKRGGQPTIRTIGEANGLGHDLVHCVLQDRSGAIWAGTGFGGVSKVVSSAFLHFTDRDGLGSRIVSAIHRTPDGLLWLATMGGGVARWDGEQLHSFGKAEGLTDAFALCLGEDREGRLLVGTATQGLFRLEVDRFVTMGTRRPADRVQALLLDDTGTVWAGTSKGLFHQAPDGTWLASPGPPLAVHGIANGGDTLWAATDMGLFHLPLNGEHRILSPSPGMPVVKATSVVRDRKGTLWVGTEGHGLYRVGRHSLDSVGLGDGLPSLAVEQVLLDAFDDLWVGTRQGFTHVELDEMQDRILRVTHHGTADGFIGVEAFRNACMLDGDSTLWFGTVRGATRHDPRERHIETCEPQVRITDLLLFFERPDWGPWSAPPAADGLPMDLELPHDRNHLTFGFTGISLAFPEQVRYRYILQGHDPDWSPITATDRVTYSNLPPGDFVFRVEARNTKGWTTAPVEYSFRIAPPFWSTTPFRLGAGVFLLLAMGGFTRMRERRLRMDRERLEHTVAMRTRELATEKDRSDRLLLNILPASTAEELKTHGTARARRYESATVLFSDFSGFTNYSSQMDSGELVGELDHFFRLFDRLCDKHGVEKIKTIGDAYMCASGLPEPASDHALRAVRMALDMIAAAETVNAERRHKGLTEWPLRIGMHSGPVVAGVVGEKKFAYDIWGDTVNLASRMESNSVPGRINISGSTYAQVMDTIEAVPRGPIRVKGKGETQMYFVERLRPVRQ